MTGGSGRWPDLGSQNERLVTPLSDQDERLVDPQTARQAGLPVAPRPLVPRSRPAADDEPDRGSAGPGRPGSAGGADDSGDSGQRSWSGLRRLRRGRPVAAAAAVTALAAAALAAGSLTAPPRASAATAVRPAAGGWRITLNLTAKHNPQFTSITATGPAAAWAFEAFDPGTGAHAAAWQLTGSGWHKAAFPSRPNEQVPVAASSSATNVWAFTQLNFPNGRSRAVRWDGDAWMVVHTFSGPVAGAAVLGPQDVWAFGQDFFGGKPLGARHWNGHRWTAPPSGHGLVAGSGLAANDVWAVGGKQVAHWNGHVWKRTSVAALLPPTTMFVHSALAGVYEQSPTSVWVVGSGDRQDEGGPVVVLHFDGHSWSKAAQGGFGNPAQIVPDGSGGLWIPVPFTAGGPGQIVHFTGGKLHEAPLPVSGQRLIVQAIAHVPGSTRSFGAGQIHRKNNPGTGLHAVLLQVN
jgi:hypothetical protein